MTPSRHVRAPSPRRALPRPSSALVAAALACGAASVPAADPAPRTAIAIETPTEDEIRDAEPAALGVLDATVRFDVGGAALGVETRLAVERLSGRLDALERILSVRVVGHSDDVGEEADNVELARRRAESVARAFRERWPGTHVLVVAAGESAPVADNATAEGRARNRRVELQVIGVGRAETFAPAMAASAD